MRFDTMCNCIDENWKALKARIQASITGIKLNGTTYYQTDGTGICDLGTIETEPPTASEVLMDDGTSVQDAIDNHTAEIDNLGDGLADSVKNVEIVEVTDGLNIQTTKNGGSIEQGALIMADYGIALNGKKISVSDEITARIDDVYGIATTASTNADTGITLAGEAWDYANSVNDIAVAAQDTANVALENANNAFAKADNAIISIGTAIVDTALEMNIDKNDGSTATEPLFTAGTNLTWDGTTLNADYIKHSSKYAYGLVNLFKNAEINDIVRLETSASYDAIGVMLPMYYAINTGQYGAEMHVSSIGTTMKVIKYPMTNVQFIGIVTEKGTSYMRINIFQTTLNHYNLSANSEATVTVDSGSATTITVANALSAIDNTGFMGTLTINYSSSTDTATINPYYEPIMNTVSYEGVQTTVLCTLFYEIYSLTSCTAFIYT